MSFLTVAELLEHVETDLKAAALQRMIDAAEQDISGRFGEPGQGEAASQVTDDLDGGDRHLFTSRPMNDYPSSVVEISGTQQTELAAPPDLAADFAIRHNYKSLERLSTGANPRTLWAPRVRVTYEPAYDSARRKEVCVDLVKLALQYNGLRQESTGAGDHSQTFPEYEKERTAILARMARARRMFA